MSGINRRTVVPIIQGFFALVFVLTLAACSGTPRKDTEPPPDKTPAGAPAPAADGAANPANAAAAPKDVPITTASADARKLYLQGRDLVEKLRVTDGNAYFHQAVEKDPDFGLAWLAAANSSASAADFFDEMKKAVAASSKLSEGEQHMIMGADAGARAEPARVEEHYTKLVAMFPDDPRANMLLGTYYFGTQDYAKAIASYDRAVAKDPSFSPAYNQLGYAHRFMAEYPQAEDAFKKYIELIPNDPNPYDSYAELLMKMGRFEDSIAQYEKALAIDANFVPSYIGIANDQMFMGKSTEARKTLAKLQSVARNDGERRQALTWMLATYLHEGKMADAKKTLHAQREIAQKTGDLAAVSGDYQIEGDMFLNTGAAAAAMEPYRKAVETMESANVPDEVKQATQRNAMYNEARAALAKGDLKTARARADAYQKAVDEKKRPFEVRQAHELAGRIATAEGDYPRAIEELSAANQQNPLILYYLAVAYKKSGDAAKAKEMADKAAGFNQENLNYAYVRGKAKEMLKSLS